MGKEKNNSFTTEQLIDKNLKNIDGESRKEVYARMEKTINNILRGNIGKRIAIVSHGMAIKSFLMKWCKLNEEKEIQFKDKVIKVNSPGIIKLVFEDDILLQLEEIV